MFNQPKLTNNTYFKSRIINIYTINPQTSDLQLLQYKVSVTIYIYHYASIYLSCYKKEGKKKSKIELTLNMAPKTPKTTAIKPA